MNQLFLVGGGGGGFIKPKVTGHPGAFSVCTGYTQNEVMSAASDTANTSITLSASTEYQSYGVANDQCWAVVSLKAPFYEPTARAPVDIVAVIDKSGSMRGTKIEMVKKTLVFVIDQCEAFSSCSHTHQHVPHEGEGQFISSSYQRYTYLCSNTLKSMDVKRGIHHCLLCDVYLCHLVN